MGYALLICECFFCKNMMACNPNKVPSIKDPKTGVKEPICAVCHEAANQIRIAHGLEPWPAPLEGAYEACPEEEL